MALHPVPLEELFGQIMFSSMVTRNDRQQLRAAILGNNLSDDEKAIINRLLYNVRRGWVRLVDL